MKLSRIVATGALALSLAAPALANQVAGKVQSDWVMMPLDAEPPYGKPVIGTGWNNYKHLSDCNKAIDADIAQNPDHWDYCAKFNHAKLNPADSQVGGMAVVAPDF